MAILKTVSTNILELRKERGLSQETFAKSIGVCANTICNYETGKTSVSQKAISEIKRVYGVDVTSIAVGRINTDGSPVPEKLEDEAAGWESNRTGKESLSTELKRVRDNNEGLHAVIDQRDAEIEKLKTENGTLKAENKNLNERVNELEGKLATYITKDGFGAEPRND